MNEESIIEEIKKRIKELQGDREVYATITGGKDGWIAFNETDEGMELLRLQEMLSNSDIYVPSRFDGLLY